MTDLERLRARAEEVMGSRASVEEYDPINGCFDVFHPQFKLITGNVAQCLAQLEVRETYLFANAGLGSRKTETTK